MRSANPVNPFILKILIQTTPRAGRVNLEVRELRKHECRRCLSSRLLILEKKRQEDNEVYRCRECGYLFSPPPEQIRSS